MAHNDTTETEATYDRMPGMYAPTGRCLTCDGRYCGPTCDARPGHVWVGGKGWVAPIAADAMAAGGLTVNWADTADRYLD